MNFPRTLNSDVQRWRGVVCPSVSISLNRQVRHDLSRGPMPQMHLHKTFLGWTQARQIFSWAILIISSVNQNTSGMFQVLFSAVVKSHKAHCFISVYIRITLFNNSYYTASFLNPSLYSTLLVLAIKELLMTSEVDHKFFFSFQCYLYMKHQSIK